MITRVLALVALGMASLEASAGDFSSLMDVVKATWPDKTHIAVVADYTRSAMEIQNLADAAGSGSLITVLDTHNTSSPYGVPRVILNKIKPDYVVLLRSDPTFRDGTLESTWLVRQVALAGIPSIGTTPTALRQGAVFAVGTETGNELMVNSQLKGSIHVILPRRATLAPSAAVEGRAEIRRMSMASGAAR